jgi:hypothetical protein
MFRKGPRSPRRTNSGTPPRCAPSQAFVRHRAQGSRNPPRGRPPFHWHRFNAVLLLIPYSGAVKPALAANQIEARSRCRPMRSRGSWGSIHDRRSTGWLSSFKPVSANPIPSRAVNRPLRRPALLFKNLRLVWENYGVLFREVNHTSPRGSFCKLWNAREQDFRPGRAATVP